MSLFDNPSRYDSPNWKLPTVPYSEDPERDWPEPTPLDAPCLPDFPTTEFPEWLMEFADAEARATQTPKAAAALFALGALSTACQRIVGVRTPWVRPETVNLYALVSMGVGERKSTVHRDCTAPLSKFEQEENERRRSAFHEAESELRMLAARIKRAERDAENADEQTARQAASEIARLSMELETKQRQRTPMLRLLVENITTEAAVSIAAEQGGYLAYSSGEAGDVLEVIAGHYSEGKALLGLILDGYHGGSVRVDRKGRPSEYIESAVLTMVLAAQPVVLAELMSNRTFRERGLCGRFLYAVPESMVGQRDTRPHPMPEPVHRAYHNAIARLLGVRPVLDATGRPTRYPLDLDGDAMREESEFGRRAEDSLHPVDGLLGVQGGELVGWGNRIRGNMLRIAGLLHMADAAGSDMEWRKPITGKVVRRAISIMEGFVIPHALAAFSDSGASRTLADARFLEAWTVSRGHRGFSRRDITHHGGRFKGDEGGRRLDAAILLLEEHGHLRRLSETEEPGRPGRPASPRFALNPMLDSAKPGFADFADYNGQSQDTGGAAR